VTTVDSTAQFESFVDANAVARYLKLTRRQVLEMTRKGFIPGYPLGTSLNRRIWRYKLSEIDAAVAAGPKNAPERAVGHSAISSTISAGSPRSQKGKL
jgi:hypothetical protein